MRTLRCRTALHTFVGVATILMLAFAAGTSAYAGNPKQNRSPALWVTNAANIVEFWATKLRKSGTPKANYTLTNPNSGQLGDQDLTFDRQGNLWVTFQDGYTTGGFFGSVDEFTPTELQNIATGASFAPHVDISYPNINSQFLDFPQGLTFDNSGALWVANSGGNRGDSSIVEFTPSQLALGGFPVPKVSMTSTYIDGPSNLRFDPSGNLWVLGGIGNNQSGLFEFPPDQLVNTDQAVPSLIFLSPAPNTYLGPIAVDTSGNLWVGHGNNLVSRLNTLVMYRAADLQNANGIPPQPAVTISSAIARGTDSFAAPLGLAFDPKGDLWLLNWQAPTRRRQITGSIVEFTANQLTASGAPVPKIVLKADRNSYNLSFPRGLAFGPAF